MISNSPSSMNSAIVGSFSSSFSLSSLSSATSSTTSSDVFLASWTSSYAKDMKEIINIKLNK